MPDKWGRRFFKSAAIVLALFGLFHALSLIQKPAASNDTERQLLDLMANYKFPLPGAVRSMGDLMQGFSLALSLLSLALGAINLAISGQGTAILRRLALINVLWLAAMTVNSLYHWFVIPTGFLVIALVLFALAWVKLPGDGNLPSGG